MKNLTHYFRSPTEGKTNEIQTEQLIEIAEEKEPGKKRKISLSKSKKKKVETPEKQFAVDNKKGSEVVEHSPEQPNLKKNKKRKIEDNCNSSSKKLKTSKGSLKKSKTTNKISHDEQQNIHSEIDGKNEEECVVPETQVGEAICAENSISFDESLFRANRPKKSKKPLFLDSDEESSNIASPKPSGKKIENDESTSTMTSRHSLFSYFNKVDKETAIKKQKCEKMEIRALIHTSPSGSKIIRKDLNKVNVPTKKRNNKSKNKIELDDGDSIEVISSEEIMDENSSSHVNVLLEPEKSDTAPSPNIVNVPNPSNLASIFIPKKIVQQTKVKEECNSAKSDQELIPVSETPIVVSEKETKQKKSNRALSKSKNLLKKNNVENIKSLNDEAESVLKLKTVSNKKESRQLLTHENYSSTVNKSSNTLPSTKKNTENSTLSSSNNSRENNLSILPSTKSVITSRKLNSCEDKTANKGNNSNVESNTNDNCTPNKKGSTLNGYFTPKNQSISTIKGSGEKSAKSAKAPWVMKVCLNSASKTELDSDDDYKASQDSGKGESETQSNSPEEMSKIKVTEAEVRDLTSPVVIIDDDDDNNSSEETVECHNERKKRLFPRNAKKPKPDIIEEEEEVKEIKPQTSKTKVKLWPFFQKVGDRQSKGSPVDEAKLKAKMLFLESGVPESIKRKVEIVNSEAILGKPAPFPTVSHIAQAEKEICAGTGTETLPLPRLRSASPPPTVSTWTPVLAVDSSEESEIPVFERRGNVKAFLEKLKEEEPKTEVKVLYKKLKEYKSKAESDIWTEVYKPTISADMVGNSENIKKLKTWLETLKNCRKREGSVSSGDEFVNEDSDGDDSSFNNMAVICGPCGCGKTSAVYAIARELDIKVLEINASCNRSGKRILAEFSESTQSHHVERSQPMNDFFNNQSSGKKKRKKLKNLHKSKSEKTSLILVEDADLLFTDCDDGFVPALASLAASSKRPIVLVTNQENTPHLDRFNNTKLLRISFNRPRPNKLSLWLRLVGLVEGVMMSSETALRLVTVRNCDVRRCLLELQLMVHSNNSEVKDKLNPSRLWWGWPGRYQLSYELPTLLEPEEEEAKPEVDKKHVLSQLQAVANTSRRLAHLDMLSASSREECLEEYEDPCPASWSAKWRDSTSLMTPTAANQGPSLEATWLQQVLASSQDDRIGQTPQEARWLSILRQAEQMFMPGVTTTAHTAHQAVACDYLPSLRELGRSEQVRLANYTRRANRFFNYLQGLGIHASKSYRDFMCDAFS